MKQNVRKMEGKFFTELKAMLDRSKNLPRNCLA